MEELYRRPDRYSTLEDNIRETSQTVMITAQNIKSAKKGQPEQKGSYTKNQKRSREQSGRKREPPKFTPLDIPYNRLLPLIQDHLDFVWPPPIRSDPKQRNRSLRCDYHRDQGHETNKCRTLKFLVEKLIRAGHLRGNIQDLPRPIEVAPVVERIADLFKAPVQALAHHELHIGRPSQ